MTDSPTMPSSPPQPGDAAPPEEAASDEGPRGLPRALFIGILVAVVGLFVATRGALWRDPWNAAALDSAIFWSYLPIPFLVGAGLLAVKRFSWRFLFLESLAITLLKYAATFSIALAFWMTTSPPPPTKPAATPHTAVAQTPAPEAPTPTPIPPETTGALRGTVKDASGAPVPAAFVYVSAGLESFVFERPKDPVHLENDGAGVHPDLVVARAGQPIQGRSLDGHLHTLVASGDASGTTFNIPMMSSGAWSTVLLREPAQLSRLRCTVHPTGEAPAYLVVLDHPYSTRTSPDGSFHLPSLPSTKLTLSAWHPTLGTTSLEATITPRSDTTTDLKLTPPPAP